MQPLRTQNGKNKTSKIATRQIIDLTYYLQRRLTILLAGDYKYLITVSLFFLAKNSNF